MPENTNTTILGQEVVGTAYPYINTKQNLLNPFLSNLRRSVSSVNPFALQQVPSQDRMGLGARYGNQFYQPDVYPNGITFQRMFPTHYDPLKAMNRPSAQWQIQAYAPGPHSILSVTADKMPRGCVRALQNFKRCETINGKTRCKEEASDVVDICPNWCLDAMKEKSRFMAKLNAINNHQFNNAMSTATYNQDRTVADVSDKNWVHGTRHHLRPDTMWADNRYATITQTEVNQAKARVAARESAKSHGHHAGHHDAGHHDDHHDHHYDFKHVSYNQQKPLYP